MIDRIKQYGSDVVTELKKVTWPTQDELKESTIVVLTVAGILALFTFLADESINFVIKQFVRV